MCQPYSITQRPCCLFVNFCNSIVYRERHQKQRHNTEHYDQQVNAFSENKRRVYSNRLYNLSIAIFCNLSLERWDITDILTVRRIDIISTVETMDTPHITVSCHGLALRLTALLWFHNNINIVVSHVWIGLLAQWLSIYSVSISQSQSYTTSSAHKQQQERFVVYSVVNCINNCTCSETRRTEIIAVFFKLNSKPKCVTGSMLITRSNYFEQKTNIIVSSIMQYFTGVQQRFEYYYYYRILRLIVIMLL